MLATWVVCGERYHRQPAQCLGRRRQLWTLITSTATQASSCLCSLPCRVRQLFPASPFSSHSQSRSSPAGCATQAKFSNAGMCSALGKRQLVPHLFSGRERFLPHKEAQLSHSVRYCYFLLGTSLGFLTKTKSGRPLAFFPERRIKKEEHSVQRQGDRQLLKKIHSYRQMH